MEIYRHEKSQALYEQAKKSHSRMPHVPPKGACTAITARPCGPGGIRFIFPNQKVRDSMM